jgi:predicted nucleic acid-binding Zn ribbon protein
VTEKKKSKKPSVLISASSVLQSLLGNSKSPLADSFLRWKLWRYWEDIVGKTLADMSVPVELVRGRLVIWARSSANMQDLHFMSDAIKLKVNKYLGNPKVKSIRFTLDESRVPQRDSVAQNFDME